MAKERLSMGKIKEILRLKHECGLGVRQIGESLNIAHSAVVKYLKLAKESKISWPEVNELREEEIERRIFKVREDQRKGRRKAVPDWNYVYEELKRPKVTLELLWQEYREENPEGYQYGWFCDLYWEWRKKLRISMRQNHKAGEKMFVDYCDGLSIVDRSTGEEIRTQLFVGVWGASNYTYAEASLGQDKRSWIMSHVRGFEYSGKVPHIVVLDNLKAGVNKACRYEPELNQSYLELSEHYGFAAIPARPRHPKDKAKAEAGVLVVQRWILAALRNRKFFSLNELNEEIRKLLEKLNNRKMQKLKMSRREMFEKLDKPAAQVLAEKRYEYSEWKKSRVNIDYHIEIDSHYYSVPCQLRGEVVDVRLTQNVVEIFYKGRRQHSHARGYRKHQHTTCPEHMPQEHRKYLEWTPTRILNWAEKMGQNTKIVIKNILEGRKHPEQGYRSCLGILRLTKQYSKERLENACRRAVKYQTFSYKSVKTILANGLDEQPDTCMQTAETKPVMHENIRGKNYYDNDTTTLH